MPWMTTPSSRQALVKAAHLLKRDAFLDVLEDVGVADFVADQEQAQAAVLHELDRVVVDVGAAVARPGHARAGLSLLAISRARGRLAVKVSSSKKNSFTCGKSFFA